MNIIDFLSSLTNWFSFDWIFLQFNNISIILISAYIWYKLRKDLYTAMLALVFYIFAHSLIRISQYLLLGLWFFYIIYRLINQSNSSKENNIVDLKLTKFWDDLFDFVSKIINKALIIMLILMIISFLIALVIKLLKWWSIGIFWTIILLIARIILYWFIYNLFKYFILFIKTKRLDNQICDTNWNTIIKLIINPYLFNIDFIYQWEKLKIDWHKLNTSNSNNSSSSEKIPYLWFYKYELLLKDLLNKSWNIQGYLSTLYEEKLKIEYNTWWNSSHRWNITEKIIYEFDIKTKILNIIIYKNIDTST